MTKGTSGLGGYEVVLIGCGRMGGALVGGAIRSGALAAGDVQALDTHDASRLAFCERTGVDPNFRATSPRIVVLAVKPADAVGALEAFGPSEGDVVVSVAAGVSLEALKRVVRAPGVRFVRSMPNTPALVGAGITGLYFDGGAEIDAVNALFEAVGETVLLKKEAEFHAVTALSGSGPAFVFTILEALADAGVREGLSRETARALALQTLIGAGELAKFEQDVHTAELKDRVASPAGTTIAGLALLEARGFRGTLIDAVSAAAERSREIGKKIQ